MTEELNRSRLLLCVGAAVAGIATLVAPQTAGAATATGSMAVSSTIQASCSVSASALAFGTYSGSQLDATTTVDVTCTNTTPYNIGLNAGTGTGATVSSRKMTAGSTTLNYALYSDSGHATNWGNTVGTDTVTGTGTGASQSLTVYGRIAGSQTSAPGSYADTITVTVTY